MKKYFLRYRMALFALSIVSSVLFAEQKWHGVYVYNVLDEDLLIKDDCLMPLSSTRIEAVKKDVTVRLSKSLNVAASWAGESQLYLMAAEGRTIRFEIDQDFSFLGSSVSGDPLLIVQSGPGTVEIAVANGKTFSMTSSQGSGGVQMYVLMYGGESAPCDEYCTGEEYCFDEYTCKDEYCALGAGFNETSTARPTLRFVNFLGNEDVSGNNTVVVGNRSRLSFLSSRPLGIARDSGFIVFDPTRAVGQTGRMILEIENGGSFVAAGNFTCQRNGGFITSADIDPSIPAGYMAEWSISTTLLGVQQSNSLLLLNQNRKMPQFLIDPFLNLNTSSAAMRAGNMLSSNYVGKRYGVFVGANGVLHVGRNMYLDYVGLSLNQAPAVAQVAGFDDVQPNRLIKVRNASALFVDGDTNPLSMPAMFAFDVDSAIFFRSGVAQDGSIRWLDDVDPFTIDPAERTPGIGNIVFDVEGELSVVGQLINGLPTSKLEILSLEVLPAGGSLFVGSPGNLFPRRTFNMEDGQLLAYNSGSFMINNALNLYNTALSHTDVNHRVVVNNDFISEPTYVGGETYKLIGSPVRPSIRFYNSQLLVNSDIALTGLDLAVPNLVDAMEVMQTNDSSFVFYTNGACADNGNGRNMILGTRIGSTAADGISRVSSDADIDIIQLFNSIGIGYPSTLTDNQTLRLMTRFNSVQITNQQPGDGDSINTIFLGHNSNITIGTDAPMTDFNIDTNPTLDIDGNYFSFTAKSGLNGCPNASNVTGKNGIFVDLNGLLTIEPCFIASFCTMITKNFNGMVNLPSSQVFFCNGVGIADGNVDLNPDGQILVPAGQTVADYIFDWNLVQKNCSVYSPYQGGCCCATATQANVRSLPIIQGTVDNLIIDGSRFGDPASIIIDGGIVRNITFAANNAFAAGCNPLSGQAPVANIILRNNAIVELSNTTIGGTGVTIIADGSGVVEINSDVIVGAGCPFVAGDNFTPTDVLTINSTTSNAVRVPSSGSISFESFNNAADTVQFTGNVQLIIEPGATLVTGAGILSFADNSQLVFESSPTAAAFFAAIPHGAHNPTLNPLAVVNAAHSHNMYASLIDYGAGLGNTDAFRARLAGKGTIVLRDNARGSIPNNAFVGVETASNAVCSRSTITDLELQLLDNAIFEVGELNDPQGGVLQIGNVTHSGSVSFTLTINGINAGFYMGSEGFVGLGVGIVRYDGTDASCTLPAGQCIVPNENIVNTLFDVNSITFNFLQGRFEANRIFSGDDNLASLLALSGNSAVRYNMNLASTTNTPFNMAGGTNMVLIMPGTGGVHPIVLNQDGQAEVAPGVFSTRLWASILASSLLQDNTLSQTGLTGLEFFDVLKVHDAILEPNRPNTFGMADAATDGEVVLPVVNTILLGTVSQGAILRASIVNLIGAGSESEKRQIANEVGAVAVNIDQTLNEILSATIIDA